MVYLGSKSRIAKDLIEIIDTFRESESVYIEPFVGGCNMIDKVKGYKRKIGLDNNIYLISFLQDLQNNRKDFYEYKFIDKETYDFYRKEYRKHKENSTYKCDLGKIGYIGVLGSFRGGFYDFGYAGKTNPKKGTPRNYVKEKFNNLMKQVDKLKDIEFYHCSYDEFNYYQFIKNDEKDDIIRVIDCIIYCDIPYKNTKNYGNKFNHNDYWEWCREMSKQGFKIFTSELQAPDDFVSIYNKNISASVSDESVSMSENLFIHISLYDRFLKEGKIIENIIRSTTNNITKNYNTEEW